MSKPAKARSLIRGARERLRCGLQFLTAGRWMVERMEAAVAVLLRGTFSASERLESIDSVLATAVRALLAPCRGAAWLLKLLIPPQIIAAVGRRGSALSSVARRSAVAVVRVTRPICSVPLLIVARATWPISRPIAALAGFARAWLITRSVRQVVWGLPALLLLLPVAGLGFVEAPHENKAVVAGYRNALATASQEGDLPRANLYERKLQQLGVSTARQAYERALALAASGQLAEAYRGMSELAPADERGYPPAHLWIAQHAFTGTIAVPSEREALVDQHLARLEELGQKGMAVELLAGLRLRERGEQEGARRKLAPLADELPLAATTLFQLDLELRRDDDLLHDAAMVVRHLEREEAEGKLLRSGDYYLLSVALQIRGDAEPRRDLVLRRWSEQHPDDPRAQREMRRFAQSKFERLVGATASSPGELATLLKRADQLGAELAWLKTQLQNLYAIRDESIVSNPLPEQVIQILVSDQNTSPSILHALGNVAAESGEWARAEGCFRRVVEVDPANAVAWNNAAWVVLQQGDKTRLRAAMADVERALALAPLEPHFRETRGQIWLRMGEWERALVDLEYAHTRLPPSLSLENALAAARAASHAPRREEMAE